MKRVQAPTDADNLLAAVIGIYSLSQRIERADALVSLPGQHEHFRVIESIHWWQKGQILARYLLIAGQNPSERTKEDLDLTRLSQPPFNLTRTEGLILEPLAQHTKGQTDWVAEQVKEKGVVSLALFTAPYHLLRSYLTLLKSLTKINVRIPIIPSLSPIDLAILSPELGVPMWDMIAGEAQRVSQYQEKGDVATLKELKEYLSWLHESQFLL